MAQDRKDGNIVVLVLPHLNNSESSSVPGDVGGVVKSRRAFGVNALKILPFAY